MIRIVYDTLRTVFDEVIIAGGDTAGLRELGLDSHPDPVAGKGALGGIYNGLLRSASTAVFVCGCDMPLIKPAAIRTVLQAAADEDILIPLIDGIRQPLHAVYRRTILPSAERLATQDNCYLPDLLGEVNVRYLEEATFADVPDYALSFVSLNDQDMVAQYRRHLERL